MFNNNFINNIVRSMMALCVVANGWSSVEDGLESPMSDIEMNVAQKRVNVHDEDSISKMSKNGSPISVNTPPPYNNGNDSSQTLKPGQQRPNNYNLQASVYEPLDLLYDASRENTVNVTLSENDIFDISNAIYWCCQEKFQQKDVDNLKVLEYLKSNLRKLENADEGSITALSGALLKTCQTYGKNTLDKKLQKRIKDCNKNYGNLDIEQILAILANSDG